MPVKFEYSKLQFSTQNLTHISLTRNSIHVTQEITTT